MSFRRRQQFAHNSRLSALPNRRFTWLRQYARLCNGEQGRTDRQRVLKLGHHSHVSAETIASCRGYSCLGILPDLHTHDLGSCSRTWVGCMPCAGPRPQFEHRMRDGSAVGTGRKVRSSDRPLYLDVNAATGTRFRATPVNAPSCTWNREHPWTAPAETPAIMHPEQGCEKRTDCRIAAQDRKLLSHLGTPSEICGLRRHISTII